jgi:hypothetical protein
MSESTRSHRTFLQYDRPFMATPRIGSVANRLAGHKPRVCYVAGTSNQHTESDWSRFLSRFEVLPFDCKSGAEFQHELRPGGRFANIDAVLSATWVSPANPGTFFPPATIDAMPDSVKIIACSGAGFNHIDIEWLNRRGILYCRSPGAGTEATADVGLCLILSSFRHLSHCENLLRTDF